MGNNLHVLAHAKFMQLEAEKEGIPVKLIAQHQNAKRWEPAHAAFVTCFPKLRDLNFFGGDWDPAFREARELQHSWLSEQQQKLLENADGEGIGLLKQLLEHENSRLATVDTIGSNSSYSVPYLRVNSFVGRGKLFSETAIVREWFEFDEENPSCCTQPPFMNETVLHVRNFANTKGARSHNLFDASPETITVMFQNFSSNDQVAIVGQSPALLKPYERALKELNVTVRIGGGDKATQDFCFLRSAHKELIGCGQSTFFVWASALGKAEKVRLYYINRKPSPVPTQFGGNQTLYVEGYVQS